ncbi:MAG TPA: arginyltransferase [Gammaproteobacteria bacterium]|nr:arginyltransferase [Gammaproteobacteria bacterium]
MSLQHLRVYSTPPHACSYLEGETAVNAVLDPGIRLTPALYSYLIDHGFRRSGGHVYAPHCPDCSGCLSSRIRVSRFEPTRSQRRCLKRNRDLTVRVVEARYTDEYFDLYQRYLMTRHPDGEMSNTSPVKFRDFLLADWCDTVFIELRLGGKLLGVAVTDVLEQGFSAVYTFFDATERKRGLGVFSILSQISQARHFGLPLVYLGYLIEDCPKMRYKSDYHPLETLVQGQWRDFTPSPTQPESP